MITLRTIRPPKRRLLFVGAAVADLLSRAASASIRHDIVLFAARPEHVDLVSISEASGLAVPTIAAPIVLSPLAYLLGQVLVVEKERWVRFVSATFIAASFLCYLQNPGLSILLAALAYLILGSGIIGGRASEPESLRGG